jgi:nucleoside-diphosphate-sugar epimerase
MTYTKSTPITIIGSNGGTGAAIVDELMSQGFTNLTGLTISGKEKWGRRLNVIQADALDKEQLTKATKDSQIIFGAFNASEYTDKSWETEFPVFITNFIECGRASGAKLIFMDNVYSYKNLEGQTHYNENTAIVPTNKKGQIRKAVMQTFVDGLKSYNLQGNIIKSSDLYGPYGLNSVIGDRYFETLFKKNVAEIIPLGNHPHSLTYTKDVGRIAVQVAITENQPLVVHTPNAPAKGYQDMVRMTYPFAGQTPKESISPMYMFHILAIFVPPIKSMLGMMYQWKAPFVIDSLYNTEIAPTSLKNGMKETVSWFRENLK